MCYYVGYYVCPDGSHIEVYLQCLVSVPGILYCFKISKQETGISCDMQVYMQVTC